MMAEENPSAADLARLLDIRLWEKKRGLAPPRKVLVCDGPLAEEKARELGGVFDLLVRDVGPGMIEEILGLQQHFPPTVH